MKHIYIAVDPISSEVVAKTDTLKGLRRQVAELDERPQFSGLGVPLYRCELRNGQAIHCKQIGEIA